MSEEEGGAKRGEKGARSWTTRRGVLSSPERGTLLLVPPSLGAFPLALCCFSFRLCVVRKSADCFLSSRKSISVRPII